MKLRVFDMIATPPPKKKVKWEPEIFCFCLIFADFFFLTLLNKQYEMSGDHDWRTQWGKSRRSPGGAWEND